MTNKWTEIINDLIDNEKKFIIKGGRTNHLYYRLKKTFKKKGATIQNMHIHDFFPSKGISNSA